MPPLQTDIQTRLEYYMTTSQKSMNHYASYKDKLPYRYLEDCYNKAMAKLNSQYRHFYSIPPTERLEERQSYYAAVNELLKKEPQADDLEAWIFRAQLANFAAQGITSHELVTCSLKTQGQIMQEINRNILKKLYGSDMPPSGPAEASLISHSLSPPFGPGFGADLLGKEIVLPHPDTGMPTPHIVIDYNLSAVNGATYIMRCKLHGGNTGDRTVDNEVVEQAVQEQFNRRNNRR